MWYNTSFDWKLKFKKWLTVEWLAFLNTILWEDIRHHPEWTNNDLTYINLEVIKDLTWIIWNGSENTYDLDEKIELVIKLMTEKFPEFWLSWKLSAQWEEFDDKWVLIVEDNKVSTKKLKLEWDIIECPHCEEKFILNNK